MKFLKKALLFLATGSLSVILAACYGPPTRMQNIRLIRTKDKSGNPIPGLKLKLYQKSVIVDSLMTNSNGEGIFLLDEKENTFPYTVSIEDIDEESNGGYFLSQKIKIPYSSEGIDVTVSE